MKRIFILLLIIFSLLFCDLYSDKIREKGEYKNMAIELIPAPTGGAPLTTDDYNAQNVLAQAMLYHLMQNTRHLTEWDTLVKPELEENSYIQHGGANFQVQTNDYAITGAPANGRVYVKITRTADELDAAFVNSAVGYSWNNVYNGFYHADGTQLLPYVLYKTAAGYYKYTLNNSENKHNITSKIIIHDTIDIGVWNMDTTATVQIGFDDIITQLDSDLTIDEFSNYVYINRINIINDLLTQIRDLTSGSADNGFYIDKSNNWISLYRQNGGVIFDSIDYNDGTMNRGHIHYTAKI